MNHIEYMNPYRTLAIFAFLITAASSEDVKNSILLPPEQPGPANVTLSWSSSHDVVISFLEEAPRPFPIARVNSTEISDVKVTFSSTNGQYLGLQWPVVNGYITFTVNKRQDFEDSHVQGGYFIKLDVKADTLRIFVKVENINDNPTILATSNSICNVDENWNGTTNCSITATDEDGGLKNVVFDVYEEGKISTTFALKSITSGSSNETFSLIVLEDLNFEERSIYSLNVTANVENVFSTSIVVKVQDMPDLPPIWYSKNPVFIIPEENEFNVTLIAKDGDVMVNAPILYWIDSTSDYFSINNDTGRLDVKAIDRDIPGNDEFRFNAIAYEKTHPDYETEFSATYELIFMIQDIDDNEPKFNLKNINMKIKEGSLTLNYDHDIVITDPDVGENGTFTVELKDLSQNQYTRAFSVIPNQGYQNGTFSLLVVNSNLLDYENEDWRHIDMKLVATEVANASHVTECDVHIDLENVNDEFPEFNQTQFDVFVKENVHEGYHITTLTAVDRDGAIDRITYSTTSESVTIDNSTGVVRATSKSFDHELQPELFVQIKAADLAGHFNYTQLKITVNDTNDVAPTIHLFSQKGDILENATINEPVQGGKIGATDPDLDAELLFGIDWNTSSATKNGNTVNEDAFTESFAVVKDGSCEPLRSAVCYNVVVAKLLRWDIFDSITLNITVTDNNTDPEYPDARERSATLVISITDVNNNPPEFDHIPFLKVDENSAVNMLIDQIGAFDKDYNQVLTFYLEEIDAPAGWVNINSTNGYLYVGSPHIDREEYDSLTYEVTVSDGVFKSNTNISIHVKDENDCFPKVNNPTPILAQIYENSKNGTAICPIDPDNVTSICYINATDGDKTAPYNVVSYLMDDLYENTQFAINLKNGSITVSLTQNATLDREIKDSYDIHITVWDNYNGSSHYNSHSQSAYVKLTLLDENDNAPKFIDEPEHCQGNEEFPESMNVGELLVSISAKDIDEQNTPFSKINFTIERIIRLGNSQNPDDTHEAEQLFTIVTRPAVGDVYYIGDIKPAQPLHGHFGRYNLTIRANDSDPVTPQTSVMTYTICIKDINDNSPVIKYPELNTTILIFDTQEPLTTIIQGDGSELPLFRATDADGGLNGQVDFYIVGTELSQKYFAIDSDDAEKNTGKLVLRKKLDIALVRSFQLTINATDRGDKPLSTMTTMTIHVLTNESHEPYFMKNEFNITIPENKKAEFNFTGAYDVDNVYRPIEEWDKIYYYIVAGNKSLFALDKNTTTLRVVEVMDYETRENHTVLVKASNNDSEPDSSVNLKGPDIMNITIFVKDVNDCAPKFDAEMYIGGIAPDDEIGIMVFKVKAVDPDTDDSVTYKIMLDTMIPSGNLPVDTNTSFKLDPDTGKLSLSFKPQNFMSGYFSFKIKATDKVGHTDVVPAEVIIVTLSNRVNFKFGNTTTFVESQKNVIKDILTTNLKYSCNIRTILPATDSNNAVTNDTVVNTLFTDEKMLPVKGSVIDQAVNVYETKIKMKLEFSEEELNWNDIGTYQSDKSSSNPYLLNQTVLIIVSAVLALLVCLLLAAFFFRTRSLNRRLDALSQTKFGSMDSGLNRVNMHVPNTNQHALEGSNPVWNEDIDNNDNISQGSGDSELVGVEDNPEFKQQDGDGYLERSGNKTSDVAENHVNDTNFSFAPAESHSPTTEM